MTKEKEELRRYYLTLVSVACRQAEGIQSMQGKTKKKFVKKLDPWLKKKEQSLIWEKDPEKMYTFSMFKEILDISFQLGEMDPENKVDEAGQARQRNNEKKT